MNYQNQADAETAPLNHNNHCNNNNNNGGTYSNGASSNNNHNRSSGDGRIHWTTAVAAACLGFALNGAWNWNYNRNAAAAGGATFQQQPQEVIAKASLPTTILRVSKESEALLPDSPQVLYRPVCQYYNTSNTAPVVLQTSMGEPSLPWSSRACLSANTDANINNNNNNNNKNSIVLNDYAMADAVLRVNFSQLAYPDRQTPILGFGGAFTEAAALNFNTLPSQVAKDTVMELLFGKTGLGYAIGRVPINSCDFSVESYTFDDVEDDFSLKQFDTNVEHDVQSGMVDMIRQASSLMKESWGHTSDSERDQDSAESSSSSSTKSPDDTNVVDGEFRLYASPWSPPAWMKNPIPGLDKDNATHASGMSYSTMPTCLRDGVGPHSKYAQAWALYFSKFLTSYQNLLGVPLWAITVQNEPEFPAPWEACAYTPRTEHDFVAHHLGPRLAQDHPDVKVLVFDHNKDHINTWAEQMLNESSQAKQYVDGIAYHWYAGGMDRLLDGALGIPNMHRLQDKLKHKLGKNSSSDYLYKDMLILGSESCHCPTTGYSGGDIHNYWSRAERYAHTILADLAAGSHGWLEWNLILDSIGGPNHLGNLCESTLLAVPHRALNNNNNNSNDGDGDDGGKNATTDSYFPLPPYEKHFPFGNRSIGDGRTREELNVLGFPAKYLDVGIAVQPIYYYMGHISRYVRPGSQAVMGIVDSASLPPGSASARIFRKAASGGGAAAASDEPGDVLTAGGGENDLARTGIELTLWPCEGSTRQQFKWWEEEQFIVVYGHDWLGNPTQSCIGRTVDEELHGLRLTDCNAKVAGKFDVRPVPDAGYPNTYQLELLNPGKAAAAAKTKESLCLVIEELKNEGGAYGPRGGSQASLGNCSQSSSSSNWILDRNTGEIMSMNYAGRQVDGEGSSNTSSSSTNSVVENENVDVCLTTGWPFLQMGAFLTPNGEAPKTVVILNEGKESANFALQDEHGVVLTSAIPPRSIQTILLN